jgi:DNA (cytosine-5)-methyltransferase 1
VQKLKIISLYTGAGGLDLGLEAAGFENAVCVELDRDSCETIRANRTWRVIHDDIHNLKSEQILDSAGLSAGEVDMLVGGPPCQPFSKSAYWRTGDVKRLSDPRADTLDAFMRVVRDTTPAVFVLENVRGLVYQGKDEGLRYISSYLDEINKQTGTNYQLSWRPLQAAQFGVPQRRERIFLVAHRDGNEFKFPEPTHCLPEERQVEEANGRTKQPCLTAWDAFGDLDEPDEDLALSGRWADLLPSIPEGENYLWHTDRRGGLPLFGWRTRYWSFLLKLAKNKPSWTVQAQPGSAVGPFHWSNRRLSTRELCRLQTFPDGYEIRGQRTSQQRQIGNAVPSLLAEVLGREIRRQLFNHKIRVKPVLQRPRLGEAPNEERVEEVPVKYHDLIGDHLAHPGTGKGPRWAAQ